jgi:hypothetical protein
VTRDMYRGVGVLGSGWTEDSCRHSGAVSAQGNIGEEWVAGWQGCLLFISSLVCSDADRRLEMYSLWTVCFT